VVEAGGVQLQRAGLVPQGQPAAHNVTVEPATLPGYETLDGLDEEGLVAPAEVLEEVRQRGRPCLRQANRYEVEPPGGRGSGIPSSPHQRPRMTPSRLARSEATSGSSIAYLSDAAAAVACGRRPC
jgi:hypothetical protein